MIVALRIPHEMLYGYICLLWVCCILCSTLLLYQRDTWYLSYMYMHSRFHNIMNTHLKSEVCLRIWLRLRGMHTLSTICSTIVRPKPAMCPCWYVHNLDKTKYMAVRPRSYTYNCPNKFRCKSATCNMIQRVGVKGVCGCVCWYGKTRKQVSYSSMKALKSMLGNSTTHLARNCGENDTLVALLETWCSPLSYEVGSW